MVPVFQMLGKCVWLKTTALFSLLSVVSKVSENLVNNRLVDHLEKCGICSISSMVLGILDQLQIF